MGSADLLAEGSEHLQALMDKTLNRAVCTICYLLLQGVSEAPGSTTHPNLRDVAHFAGMQYPQLWSAADAGKHSRQIHLTMKWEWQTPGHPMGLARQCFTGVKVEC